MRVRAAIEAAMKRNLGLQIIMVLGLAALLVPTIPAAARSHRPAPFLYAAGTTDLPQGCEGKLELLQSEMVFECPQGRVTVPYASITRMQYYQRVSREIRKMNLHWAVKPTGAHSKHNLFFIVLFKSKEGPQAIILRVLPETMRPYLAEIELRTGRRVDVERAY